MSSPAQAAFLGRCAISAPARQGWWMLFVFVFAGAHAELLLRK